MSRKSPSRRRLPARFTGPGAPPCPVARDAVRLAGLSHETIHVLRRLRLSGDACADCPYDASCQIRIQFDAMVKTALTELWEEWSSQPAPDCTCDPC